MLGTPDEQSWPGVTALPDYKTTFPKWVAKELGCVAPTLDKDGLDMLRVRAASLMAFYVCIWLTSGFCFVVDADVRLVDAHIG